jgi:glycosyltransferase involved in cell wall biosynthesis
MRFCMVTTFYPPYHFGGDAIYVHRLAQALARRGHWVDVLHDLDAYYLARRQEPVQQFEEHERVRVHRMKSPFGFLSPLATQQTGRPWLKPAIREHLISGSYDVVHFHNASLIGASAFRYGNAIKLLTTHEHWLICPMHVLWKFNREPCDHPECFACCVRGRRPPQLWRYTGRMTRDLRHIDRILSPSRFTRMRHIKAGVDVPISVLPYFVPPVPETQDEPPHPRPYFLFVGRLVALKGVGPLLDAFRRYRDADLLVVGDGQEAASLKAAAASQSNVTFLGSRDQQQLATLYRHAIALIMPSIGYEVFGIVLIEALAARTPIIVRNLGGMPEAVEDSQAGFTFRDEEELLAAMRTLQSAPNLRRQLGESGHAAYLARWSEGPHVDAYLALIDAEARARRESASRAAN